jgi:hypothetical protein
VDRGSEKGLLLLLKNSHERLGRLQEQKSNLLLTGVQVDVDDSDKWLYEFFLLTTNLTQI